MISLWEIARKYSVKVVTKEAQTWNYDTKGRRKFIPKIGRRKPET
jgi:hypothetical protein